MKDYISLVGEDGKEKRMPPSVEFSLRKQEIFDRRNRRGTWSSPPKEELLAAVKRVRKDYFRRMEEGIAKAHQEEIGTIHYSNNFY